jgi:hypothetical protein
MPVYTYYFLAPDGSVPAFEFDQCATEAEARAHALQRLLRQPERHAVEVRRGEQLIFLSTAVAA